VEAPYGLAQVDRASLRLPAVREPLEPLGSASGAAAL